MKKGQEKGKKEENKEKKPLQETFEITDVDSVNRLYHIQSESPIPPEHSCSFLETYENTPHYSYSTNNTLIAPTIHTFNTQIYEKLGTNEDFEISLTNVFGTGKDIWMKYLLKYIRMMTAGLM